MFYRYIPNASKPLCSALIQRGWRRFGCYYFHPICAECHGCKSLRIDASNFKPSRSQKRVVKKNCETQSYLQMPTISTGHLELYNRFHQHQSERVGWSFSPIGKYAYFENFVDGAHNYGREVLYLRDGKIVGVDLIDLLEDGISSIYFYYDPDYRDFSLGTYSLLKQIEWANLLNLRWIYLGYWVEGCRSFAYKTAFSPRQILDDFPPLGTEPKWI